MGFHTKSFGIVPYCVIHYHFRIIDVPLNNPIIWLIVLLGVDLGYYWAHRTSHRVALLWAGHGPHHSSEDYNFSTALRQGGIENVFFWVAYLPLAFFFPPTLYIVHKQINIIFQFFVHTETIRKLPKPIEFIFNTPSHHRVHHGNFTIRIFETQMYEARNPKYIDKNFAGMFIIWDRLFGTFEEEKEQPVYGLVHPLQTWNPIYSQYHHIVTTLRDALYAPGILNKASVLFDPPGWDYTQNKELPVPEVSPNHAKYNTSLSTVLSAYVLVQFAVTVFAFLIVSETQQNLSRLSVIGISLFIAYCLLCFGAIMDRVKMSFWMELWRIIFLWFGGIIALNITVARWAPFARIAHTLYCILSIVWFWIALSSKPKKSDKSV